MSEWREEGFPVSPRPVLSCFTDGSRHGGRTGAAFTIHNPGKTEEGLFPMGISATVFQAEVMAIIQLATTLSQEAGETPQINIYVDSYSALQSLITTEQVSGLVGECFTALTHLAVKTPVELHWIPAHCGHSGNEQVDGLAKQAAEMPFVGPEPVIPVAPQSVWTAVRDWVRKAHSLEWRNRRDCRQTKQILTTPCVKVSEYCKNLSRSKLRVLTQVITGHSGLNSHLRVMGLVETGVCPKCDSAEETRNHFLCDCESYCALRQKIFGKPFLGTEDLQNISLRELTDFIHSSGRLNGKPQGDQLR
jgi:ribonuclease HI